MKSNSVYLPENFQGRVAYAAACISSGRCIGARSFDTCFEMHDGSAVVTALVHRAAKNPKLAAGIRLMGAECEAQWKVTAEKHASVSVRELPALAARLRDEAKAAFEASMAEMRKAKVLAS